MLAWRFQPSKTAVSPRRDAYLQKLAFWSVIETPRQGPTPLTWRATGVWKSRKTIGFYRFSTISLKSLSSVIQIAFVKPFFFMFVWRFRPSKTAVSSRRDAYSCKTSFSATVALKTYLEKHTKRTLPSNTGNNTLIAICSTSSTFCVIHIFRTHLFWWNIWQNNTKRDSDYDCYLHMFAYFFIKTRSQRLPGNEFFFIRKTTLRRRPKVHKVL